MTLSLGVTTSIEIVDDKNGNFVLSQQCRQNQCQYYCHYCHPNLSENKKERIFLSSFEQTAWGICRIVMHV